MTRLPQLEEELLTAATRLQGPRRMVVQRGLRAALGVGAGLTLVVLGFAMTGNGDDTRVRPAGAPPFPAGAKLDDMLAVFRRPATPADRMGPLSGEHPAWSRRVPSADATIVLRPKADGVCQGVAPTHYPGAAEACVPLDRLRRRGIAAGTHGVGLRQSVFGIVVDGIQEVVLSAPAGPELHMEVSDNSFFVDLNSAARKLKAPGWDRRVDTLHWRYAGKERMLDLSEMLP
jgi:hypothetical protein